MKRSYLVQRLEKPRNYGQIKDSPFAFGGGLKNGGLSDLGMDVIRDIFSFDYMGAAEFEFGAVPKALNAIAEAAGKKELVAWTFAITEAQGKTAEGRYGTVEVDEQVRAIAPQGWQEEIEKRVRQWAVAPYGDLKETTHLNSTLLPQSEYDGKVVGWLELDNGFFFFTDEKMYADTAKLFGINLVTAQVKHADGTVD